jgi:hypothetical protein
LRAREEILRLREGERAVGDAQALDAFLARSHLFRPRDVVEVIGERVGMIDMRKRCRPRAVSSPGLLAGNVSGPRGEPGARKFLGYPRPDDLQRRGWAEHHLRLVHAPLIVEGELVGALDLSSVHLSREL